MAVIGTSTFTTGQVVARAVTTGFPNLRASHTMMIRVKNGQASGTYDSVIMCYVQTTGSSGNGGTYVGHNGATTTQLGFYRIADNGTIAGTTQLVTGAYGNTTTWYHLAIVYNATSGVFRTFVDGVFKAQTTSATTGVPNDTLNTHGIAAHNGKFADYAFFDRALSDAEVTSMAAYRQPQVTSGLLTFWRLDSNANDSSGNGINGAVAANAMGSNSPTLSFSTADNPPQPEAPPVAVAGTMASSSAFAGTMSSRKPVAATMASSSAFAGAMSSGKPLVGTMASSSALSAWIRPRWGRRFDNNANIELSRAVTIPSSAPFTAMVWRKSIGSISTGLGWGFALSGGGSLFLGLDATSGGVLRIVYNDSFGGVLNYVSVPDDFAWHHYALTYDGTTARAYLDGSLVASAAAAAGGGNFTALQLNGAAAAVLEMAHVKLWTAALSATEVVAEKNFYNASSQLSSLYGAYQLSWQNPTLDDSGNGRTLVDNGSAEAQTESPGQFITLIAGAMASSSALAGTAIQAQPLAGTMASSSALSANLTQILAISGAMASSSAFSGQLAKQLAGAMASSSAFSGTLIQTQALAAAMASSSSFVGELAKQVAGTLASSSSFAGALSQAQALAGAMASSSAFAGAMTTTRELIAAMASSSAFSGSLVQTQTLAGAMASSSAFSGLLSVPGAFIGILASDSAFSGSLGVTRELVGTLATSSNFAGATQALVAATMVSSSAFSPAKMGGAEGVMASDSAFAAAVLSVSRELAGVMASSSAFAGVMQAQLSGQLTSSSAFAGALTQAQALSSAMLSDSQFSGILSGGTPVSGGGGGNSGDQNALRRYAALQAGRRRIR